jgi:hypothetical protein
MPKPTLTGMNILETKTFNSFVIKDETRGEVEAVFATLGVVDKDGDIILPDAIKSGSTVVISGYGHSALFGDKPVGKGTIAVEGNKAIVRGQLFLDMAEARDTLTVLKGMGSTQQWSFGFETIGSAVPDDAQKKQGARRILAKLDTFETSPVVRGAGRGTATLGIKAAATTLDETQQQELRQIADRLTAASDEPPAINPGTKSENWAGFVRHSMRWMFTREHDRPLVKFFATDYRSPDLNDGNEIRGFYNAKTRTAWVRADLDGEELLETIGHELHHATEQVKGWSTSEPTADYVGRLALESWRRHERGAAVCA